MVTFYILFLHEEFKRWARKEVEFWIVMFTEGNGHEENSERKQYWGL